jgi:hypothetical protein
MLVVKYSDQLFRKWIELLAHSQHVGTLDGPCRGCLQVTEVRPLTGACRRMGNVKVQCACHKLFGIGAL